MYVVPPPAGQRIPVVPPDAGPAMNTIHPRTLPKRPMIRPDPAGRHVWRREYPAAWRMELFLAMCSGWAALQMWLWPNEFVIGHMAHAISATLSGQEQTWAIFCGIASVLKLGGLAARVWAHHDAITGRLLICSQCDRIAAGLTISGLFMSVVFWTIVGVSLAVDFPHSPSPILLIGLALGAAWQLAEWKPRPDRCP